MQRQKNEYYIEVYTNPYPTTAKLFKVHRGRPDSGILHPGMFALLGPYDGSNKDEALANALYALELYQTAHKNILTNIRNILTRYTHNSHMCEEVRQSLLTLLTRGV